MNSNEYDDALFSILKGCKTLPIFLDQIFGFLNRRTDFYYVSTDLHSPVGLPPNVAEQIVRQTYLKWKPKENCKISEPIIDSLPSSSSLLSVPEPLVDSSVTVPPFKEQKQLIDKFSQSENYNGQSFENYSWSQTLMEIEIIIKLPETITSRDLKIDISSSTISVQLKDGTILLQGELCGKCKHTNAIWALDKCKLEIHLDKCKEFWWDCLIKTEPKLDMNQLDCSRPFEELSDEAQAKIHELQWNQQQKLKGLPTSEDIKVQNLLKKSWNAKGSPFKEDFNPDLVKFS